MKKKLITGANVKEFISADKQIVVDKSMIVTAGAKDYLRENNVKIVYGSQAGSEPVAAAPVVQSEGLKKVVAKIVSILSNDLQVKDAATVESVTRKVLCKLQK